MGKKKSNYGVRWTRKVTKCGRLESPDSSTSTWCNVGPISYLDLRRPSPPGKNYQPRRPIPIYAVTTTGPILSVSVSWYGSVRCSTWRPWRLSHNSSAFTRRKHVEIYYQDEKKECGYTWQMFSAKRTRRKNRWGKYLKCSWRCCMQNMYVCGVGQNWCVLRTQGLQNTICNILLTNGPLLKMCR